MKFDKYLPSEKLKPYIKYFVVSENDFTSEYKVFPSTSIVIGFQYKGNLSTISNDTCINLNSAGITGIKDTYQIFRNSANIATILVYFSELAFTHFTHIPANELFNQSIALEYIFDKYKISEIEEKISLATSDRERINLVEQFILEELKEVKSDKLIIEAVKLINQSNGSIRIKELNQKLLISQSPFEKRFRKVVGTSAKKFASIVRFNSVISSFAKSSDLIEITYNNDFYDQAHFIKNFKQFTGNTPEKFKHFL